MVTQGIDNLKTFPFVKERVDDGRLELHGAHFGVANGSLLVRDPQTGEFKPPIDTAGLPVRSVAAVTCD